MGKGSELHRRLVEHPLTEEEVRAREPQIPELRLKPDISVVVDDHTTAKDVLGRLANEGSRSLYLQLNEGEAHVDAVLVPVDRYLKLVGLSLRATNEFEAVDGRLVPTDLAQADVEPVDPNAAWT